MIKVWMFLLILIVLVGCSSSSKSEDTTDSSCISEERLLKFYSIMTGDEENITMEDIEKHPGFILIDCNK